MRGWPYLSNEPSKKNINLDILKISLIWSFVGNSNVFFGTPFRSEFKIRSGPSNCFSSDQILRILNFLFAINILELLSLGKNIETASLKISTCDLEGVSMYWNIFSGIRCGNWVIDEQFFCDSFRSYPTLSEKMIIDSILNWKWLTKYLISGNEFIRS